MGALLLLHGFDGMKRPRIDTTTGRGQWQIFGKPNKKTGTVTYITSPRTFLLLDRAMWRINERSAAVKSREGGRYEQG
jgi:hypothetical protein